MGDIFKAIKKQVLFETVATYHGLTFNRNNMCLCPFHDERTPSFHSYGTHGYCHGCGKRADVIDLEAHYKGLSPYEAALSLAKRYGIQLDNKTSRKS